MGSFLALFWPRPPSDFLLLISTHYSITPSVNGKLPEYIDITAKCPASTWCNIPLPDAILSTNRVIDVNRPADSDSNVYGVIWWPSADKQITILRINTNGTNLTVDNTAKTIKLRIWFC